MSTLTTKLRGDLEKTAKKARNVAEAGARKALEALAVHESDPYRHMSEAQRDHRRKLRAQAKQLGDGESRTKRGAYEIKQLVEKLAYDQWHRLLFARFLLENNLLISPEHGVSVSLDDCEELAPSLGLKDAWAVAAHFAAVELPEIFRADDPAGAVELSVEDRKGLIQLVTGLPVEVFTASDSLGWCYQFWQAERKEDVNKSGNKIGADELPAVTQLFTEDYMVDFLLDNTLGAWHAGKFLAANPKLAENAQSEDELRQAVALPSCTWKYLRFFQDEFGKWMPAACTFDDWPKTATELTCLDPCMGSGHFVVAMFERLVALRVVEEALDEAAAVAAVIRDNLFGLEIDPRCTQIAAFNLALAAWRSVGHRQLPAMNLACSGIAPNAKREDWLKLTEVSPHLRFQMGALYDLFEKAPVLGSLINPRADKAATYGGALHELQPLLEMALAQETKDDTTHEMAVTARGLAKAAEILASQFTLVATNVPFKEAKQLVKPLQEYIDDNFSAGCVNLATAFVQRITDFLLDGGCCAAVTPHEWLFLGSYEKIRVLLLTTQQWKFLADLGERAFESPQAAGAFTALIGFSNSKFNADTKYFAVDATSILKPVEKAEHIRTTSLENAKQADQLKRPNARIGMAAVSELPLLSKFAESFQGTTTGDNPRFVVSFWELPSLTKDWEFFQSTSESNQTFSGTESVLRWERGTGPLSDSPEARIQGQLAFGRRGVFVAQMRKLPATLYGGQFFSMNGAALVPHKPEDLTALWAYCSSPDYHDEVRKIDKKKNVTNATLVKVPFDLSHWQKEAAKKYPHGLPKPFSSDPTQWLFNGHPAGADQPLHVAVARLLGYQWPRQTGSSFPDCPALGADGLAKLADEDGIVCISPIKGEAAAAERLRELLARAYGKDWSAARQEELLAQVDYAGASLEDWLRNGFFEQHCALFHHRPFIWHVWDGLKNGFSALVNYHKLTHANLEKLTFAYLGDWIRRQQAAVAAEEAGSDARLQAAQELQAELKHILEGEPPYDIFVRWKPLAQQSIGWHPDLNDGVRMNIRPFATANILRKKVKIKWDKDRGKEPARDKKEFPWFWGWDEDKQDFAGIGKEPDGNRWNDCHYTNDFKQKAREASKAG